MHYFLFSLTFTWGCKKCLKLTLADPCHICLVQGRHFFQFVRFLVCRIFTSPCIAWYFDFLQGCQIENLKEVDRCQNQYMMLLFRYPDQRIRLCNCICISTVDQVTSLWCIVFVFRLYPPTRASTDRLVCRYLQAKHGQEKVHGYLSKIMTFVLNLLTNSY